MSTSSLLPPLPSHQTNRNACKLFSVKFVSFRFIFAFPIIQRNKCWRLSNERKWTKKIVFNAFSQPMKRRTTDCFWIFFSLNTNTLLKDPKKTRLNGMQNEMENFILRSWTYWIVNAQKFAILLFKRLPRPIYIFSIYTYIFLVYMYMAPIDCVLRSFFYNSFSLSPSLSFIFVFFSFRF